MTQVKTSLGNRYREEQCQGAINDLEKQQTSTLVTFINLSVQR